MSNFVLTLKKKELCHEYNEAFTINVHDNLLLPSNFILLEFLLGINKQNQNH